MSLLNYLELFLGICLAVDAAVVIYLTQHVDEDDYRERERRRLIRELEAGEEKPYRVMGGSRKGPVS
jgi:hypothetical protein